MALSLMYETTVFCLLVLNPPSCLPSLRPAPPHLCRIAYIWALTSDTSSTRGPEVRQLRLHASHELARSQRRPTGWH